MLPVPGSPLLPSNSGTAISPEPWTEQIQNVNMFSWDAPVPQLMLDPAKSSSTFLRFQEKMP